MSLLTPCRTGACGLYALAVLAVAGTARADEKQVYAVTADGTAGINLTALSDAYYKDRLAGPGSKQTASVTGAVTHAAAAGQPFGLVGRGGRLNLWQSGLIDANRHLVNPLAISGVASLNSSGGVTPSFDIGDGMLSLDANWAQQLRFAADNKAGLQLAELSVTDTSGTPFTFNPNGPIYVSRAGSTTGIVRFGQDGARMTVNFSFPFGCWTGDRTDYHDNRYTDVYLGGASQSGGTAGYVNMTYGKTDFVVGRLRMNPNVTSANSRQAADGLTNVVTFAAAGNYSIPNMYRTGPESCLFRFTAAATIWQPGWHGELFNKVSDASDEGRFILEGVNGKSIGIRLSAGQIGSSSTVEFRGAGDVTISCGDSSNAPDITKNYTPGTLKNPDGTKIVWSHSGELILKNHPVIQGENAFPYGPGRGGVKTDSKWLTVNGTSQRFNSFYGGGTVCNIVDSDITFTVGEHGGDCEYDIVSAPATSTGVGKYNGGTQTYHTNYGWTLEKVGAGALTVKKAPPRLLRVSEGSALTPVALTLPELELAAGTHFAVSGGVLTAPEITFGEGTYLDLRLGGVFVIDVAANETRTFDFARLHGDGSSTLRKTGAGRLVLAGDASAFTGSFDVQGGTLAFDAATTVAHTAPVLTVAADATLEIPAGRTIHAYDVTVRGTPGVVDTTYSSTAAEGVSALAGLSGEGRLVVMRGQGVWTGAVNDDPTEVGNWKDLPTAPDVGTPGFFATFAENDDNGSMSVARRIAFRGIAFDDSVTGFTFARTDPAGELGVAAGGLSSPVAREAGAPMRLDVMAPVKMYAASCWNWETNTVLDLHAPLMGESTLYKTGGGKLYFHSTNSTHVGDIVVSNGNVYAYGNEPLGPSGTLRLLVTAGKTDASGHGVNLYLHNATISKNITRVGANYDQRRGIYCDANTTNVVFGAIDDGTCPQLQIPSSSKLVLAGGYTCTYFNWGVQGTVVVTNKPMVVGTCEGSAYDLVLCCSGNKFGRVSGTGSQPRGCCYFGLDVRVDDAVTFTAPDKEFCTYRYVKLNGHDLTIPALQMSGASAYVTSDRPATLTVEQGYPYQSTGVFKDAVNLVKRGTETLRINSTNTSTGSVAVTEGTLSFTNSASWRAASEVRVTGTGVLEVWNDTVFGDATRKERRADLHLANDGVYAFAAGVTGTQRVGCLYLDGATRPAAPGVYGALDNAAVPPSHRTRHITGAGLIHTVGDGLGCFLIFR